MARKPTLALIRNRLKLAAASISRLTKYQLRKGRAVSYGVLTVPSPNTTLGRTPDPFTGGN